MTDDEKKTIDQMLDAAVFSFRKRRAKEKRMLDPRSLLRDACPACIEDHGRSYCFDLRG